MSNHQDINQFVEEVRQFLLWQKRIGHGGLPLEMMRNNAISNSLDLELEKAAQLVSTPIEKKQETPTEAPKTQEEESPKPSKAIGLSEIREELGDCKRCKLYEGRQNIVFGEGNPEADIMFIGEGPGADEDISGRPFVGRAGQLLTRWIEQGMGIPREQVYIANIVKCRPPKNRDPEKDEVEACIGFVKQQIKAISPKAIVLLGRVPMMHVLKLKLGITKVHGTWYDYEGIPTMPIFHPSYCLRPPLDEKRRMIWEDIKKLLKHLDMPIPKKKKK